MNGSAPTPAAPILVLDAATPTVHAGLWQDNGWRALEATEGEALETIFQTVQRLLDRSHLELDRLGGIALGVGPGSILGLRVALMALRTWQQMPFARAWKYFQFRGLAVSARILAKNHPDDTFHVVTAFRRGQWHHLPVRAGVLGEFSLRTDETLADLSEKIHYIPTGRTTATLPVEATMVPFSLGEIESIPFSEWAEPVATPTLFLPAPPTFKTWSAQRHSSSS